jgi:cell division initiation protein
MSLKAANFHFFAGFSMELTPLDIRNQNFHKKNFGGIDPEEVKAFLETAANAFEQMSRDKTDLTERLKVAEERVNYYRQIEKTIQDAVVTMQRTVDEVKATAEKEAEIIVAEAKARAVREVESTKKEAEELRMEIEQLKQLRTNYFIRCRALIKGQEDLLSAMENDQRMQEELRARPAAPGNVLA